GDASLWITVGEPTDLSTTATGASADGFPIRADNESTLGGVCYRGVDLSGSGHWGIQFQVHPATECGLAQQMLARMVTTRHTIPAHAEPTLTTIDPCALVSRAELDPLVGPLPQQPTTATAHTCVWDGLDSVRTEYTVWASDPAPPRPVDLGDGIQVLTYDTDDSAGPGCTFYYVYRTIGKAREILGVSVDGWPSGDRTKACPAAKSIMKTEISRLPKVK
ncbi:hypothetical protein, partial [Nocardia sp. NPDC004722]